MGIRPASRRSATSSRSPSASPTSSSTPPRAPPTRTPSKRRTSSSASPSPTVNRAFFGLLPLGRVPRGDGQRCCRVSAVYSSSPHLVSSFFAVPHAPCYLFTCPLWSVYHPAQLKHMRNLRASDGCGDTPYTAKTGSTMVVLEERRSGRLYEAF